MSEQAVKDENSGLVLVRWLTQSYKHLRDVRLLQSEAELRENWAKSQSSKKTNDESYQSLAKRHLDDLESHIYHENRKKARARLELPYRKCHEASLHVPAALRSCNPRLMTELEKLDARFTPLFISNLFHQNVNNMLNAGVKIIHHSRDRGLPGHIRDRLALSDKIKEVRDKLAVAVDLEPFASTQAHDDEGISPTTISSFNHPGPDKPRSSELTPQLSNLKKYDMDAWMLYKINGFTQVVIAQMLSEKYHIPLRQGQISIAIKRAEQYAQVTGVDKKMGLTSGVNVDMKVIAVDPRKIDIGKRRDGRSRAQAEKAKQDFYD